MTIVDSQFEMTMRCPVVFGVGAATRIAKVIQRFDAKNVILISDEGNRSVGHPTRIAGYLKDAGYSVTEYYDVYPDPTDSKGDEIAAIAQEVGAELIVGIGGGSVMDTAKMVGVAIKNNRPVATFFNSSSHLPPDQLPTPPIAPVVALPTTSGSGSEMSGVAVVSHTDSSVKDSINAAAALAIVDPQLAASAPPSITGASGLDALSHAIEAFTTPSPNPLARLLALKATRYVVGYLRRAYDDGSDMEARSYLALASNYAGIAFTNTGLHFGHAFAHEVGAVFRLSHGLASAYPVSSMIRYIAKYDEERTAELAEALGAKNADEAVGVVVDLMRYCGVKGFSELGITVEQLQAVAEDAIDHNAFFYNTFEPLSSDDFKNIIAEIVETIEA